MAAYYNEIEPRAAQWLRRLIAAGEIAPGEVDERSIAEVRPDDLVGFTQCHFFAGVGVWSYALRSAGWPDERPVWTGSCPCQPFSAAGIGAGFDDARHLWPAWGALIRERRPVVCFGEQVEGKDGRAWLDLVQVDLEDWGYAVAPIVLPAAGVGAPHARHRLFFVADSNGGNASAKGLQRGGQQRQLAEDSSPGGWMADAENAERRRATEAGNEGRWPAEARGSGFVRGFWRDADWVFCTDEKWRPHGPQSFPLALADGTPGRLGSLRAYGNAIVAPVAEEFIRAYLDVTD